MLYGIIHGFCDSGILTDALSDDDGKLIDKYNLRVLACDDGLFAVNDVILAKTKKQLLSCTVINEITAVNVYADMEDVLDFMYNEFNF